MNHVHRLCRLAKDLGMPISVEHDEETHRFKVSIDKVVYKKKHLRTNIFGHGFTIQDACYDMLRKAHGGELENWTTNKVVGVI